MDVGAIDKVVTPLSSSRGGSRSVRTGAIATTTDDHHDDDRGGAGAATTQNIARNRSARLVS